MGDTANGHGAVQLFDESFGWIDVCYDSTWGDDEANVVCRQLGYESGTARSYRSVPSFSLLNQMLNDVNNTFIHSIGNFIISLGKKAYNVTCGSPFDDTLKDCTYLTTNSCSSGNLQGGVECSSSCEFC